MTPKWPAWGRSKSESEAASLQVGQLLVQAGSAPPLGAVTFHNAPVWSLPSAETNVNEKRSVGAGSRLAISAPSVVSSTWPIGPALTFGRVKPMVARPCGSLPSMSMDNELLGNTFSSLILIVRWPRARPPDGGAVPASAEFSKLICSSSFCSAVSWLFSC